MKSVLSCALLLVCNVLANLGDGSLEFSVHFPSVVLNDIPFQPVLQFSPKAPTGTTIQYSIALNHESVYTNMSITLTSPDDLVKLGDLRFKEHKTELNMEITVWNLHQQPNTKYVIQQVTAIPGFVTIFPPVVAILLVVVLNQPIIGIFAGIWTAAFFIHGYDPITSFLSILSQYFVQSLTKFGNAQVVVFALILGGFTGLLRKSGGFEELAQRVARIASTSRRGQLVAWTLGVIINISAYISIFLVGPSMLPIFDELHISREKLAFIVDTTSAPVASMSLISTYMVVEVGYISDQFGDLGIQKDPYVTYLQTLPRLYYQIFLILLALFIAVFERDFGFMFPAEKSTRINGLNMDDITDEDDITRTLLQDRDSKIDEGSQFLPKDDKPKRAVNAVVPLVLFTLVIIVGIILDGLSNLNGKSSNFQNIVTSANVLNVLLWSGTIAVIVSMVMLILQRILTLKECFKVFNAGMKETLPSMFILIFAWTLGDVLSQIHLGAFVSSGAQGLPKGLIPAFTALFASIISFASGSSLGTMAVMFPISIPLAHSLAPQDDSLLLDTIAAVVSGAAFGDHCSPFSDVTILSALVSGIPHTKHVRTQMVYAITAELIALVFGFLPTGFGLYTWWVALPLGTLALLLVLLLFGKCPGNYKASHSSVTNVGDHSLMWRFCMWCKFRLMVFMPSQEEHMSLKQKLEMAFSNNAKVPKEHI